MRVNRFTAFLIHLGISACLFVALLGIIIFVWYRWPLFPIDGGWNGIKIVAGVDLVLGPLLTLVVFKPGKPRLKLDLSIIALIQATALVAGTWIVYVQRPVLLVMSETHFFCMSADFLPRTGLKLEDLSRFSDHPYPIAIVSLPDDEEGRQHERARSFSQGGMHLRGDLFAPRNSQYLSDIKRYSVDMPKLVGGNDAAKRIFDQFEKRYGSAEKYFFIPINGRSGRAILALDREKGDFVERLDIEPPSAERA